MRSPRLGALMSRPAALLAVALDVRLHALGGLEIGQLRGDRCAIGVEACKPFADVFPR